MSATFIPVLKRITFELDDLILGKLKLPDPCPIKVLVSDKHVHLYIGPRDWEWSIESGELVSCGTDTS